MPWLYSDHGDDREVHAEQFLGDESPVEFVDGYAEVESEDGAAHLVRSDPHISFAEGRESGPSADTVDDAADGSETDGEPTCAGSTADGDPCTRTVDEPGDYCYQHG